MKRKDFYHIHSDMCKTLSNPKRQEILDNLRQKEMTVNELVKKTGISQANLSQHLAILRTKGIVADRRGNQRLLLHRQSQDNQGL